MVGDVNHVICFCDFALVVWATLHYTWPLDEESMNFHEWLSWLLNNNLVAKHAEVAVTICYARNNFFHEGKNRGVGDLVTFIQGYFVELLSLRYGFPSTSLTIAVKWSPPTSLIVKVIVDARYILAQ